MRFLLGARVVLNVAQKPGSQMIGTIFHDKVLGSSQWKIGKLETPRCLVIREDRSMIRAKQLGPGELVQCLIALAAFPEDLNFVPRTHMLAHNHL